MLIRRDEGLGIQHGVDWRALLVAAPLMSGIYAIVRVATHGWLSEPVLTMAGLAALLMAAFVAPEARIDTRSCRCASCGCAGS